VDTTIKTARFTPEERETHLWYDPIDHVWLMESNIPKHFNKAVKQGWTTVAKGAYEDGFICSMILKAPDGAITIRNPNKKRELSESQKAALFGFKNNTLSDDYCDDTEDE